MQTSCCSSKANDAARILFFLPSLSIIPNAFQYEDIQLGCETPFPDLPPSSLSPSRPHPSILPVLLSIQSYRVSSHRSRIPRSTIPPNLSSIKITFLKCVKCPLGHSPLTVNLSPHCGQSVSPGHYIHKKKKKTSISS
ncbi:hypothetical protein ABW19_dt0201842 [Dactylella cylindrospora]|nr:hypothetical protein ABW19_dt0201842 [Dactylella cylindrospora]